MMSSGKGANIMHSRVIFSVILIISLGNQPLISQSASDVLLTGRVLDEVTGETVPGAHIFFSQTTVGTVSGEDGSFRLQTDLTGSHTLVVSFVGYATLTEELNLSELQRQEFIIYLTPQPVELGSLVVTESEEDREKYEEWIRYFNQFQIEFLGLTDEAEKTEILNPWVIGFEKGDGDLFTAHAEEPIQIQNEVFGYKIEIDLIEFVLSKSQKRVHYLFYSRFTEMEPDNRRQMRKWLENRRNNYEGSFEHFLKTLFNESVDESNFEIEGRLLIVPQISDSWKVSGDIEQQESDESTDIDKRELNSDRSVQGEVVKTYRLPEKELVVRYSRGLLGLSERHETTLVSTTEDGFIQVTGNGRLMNPLALRLFGDWGADRVANLLPIDYSPFEN
jgi:hypothetical protein